MYSTVLPQRYYIGTLMDQKTEVVFRISNKKKQNVPILDYSEKSAARILFAVGKSQQKINLSFLYRGNDGYRSNSNGYNY